MFGLFRTEPIDCLILSTVGRNNLLITPGDSFNIPFVLHVISGSPYRRTALPTELPYNVYIV